MGLIAYFPLLYIHIKFGGKALYYAAAVSFLPALGALGSLFSPESNILRDILFLALIFFGNVFYFAILERLKSPILYVLFALLGGLVLLYGAGTIIVIIENILGISLVKNI